MRKSVQATCSQRRVATDPGGGLVRVQDVAHDQQSADQVQRVGDQALRPRAAGRRPSRWRPRPRSRPRSAARSARRGCAGRPTGRRPTPAGSGRRRTASRRPGGHRPGGDRPARTAAVMRPVLGHHHRDQRNVPHLAALEADTVALAQLTPAATAGSRKVIFGAIWIGDHTQSATRGTGLTAPLAPAGRGGLLLRPAEGIGRGRHRGVARVPAQAPLQLRHPSSQPLVGLDQALVRQQPTPRSAAGAARSTRGDPRATQTPIPTT